MSRKLAHILLLSGIVLFVALYLFSCFSSSPVNIQFWAFRLLLFYGFTGYQLYFAQARLQIPLSIFFVFLLIGMLFRAMHWPFPHWLYYSIELLFFGLLAYNAWTKKPTLLSLILLAFPIIFAQNVPHRSLFKVTLLEIIVLIFTGISIAVYLLDPPEHEKTERGTHPEEKNKTSPDF